MEKLEILYKAFCQNKTISTDTRTISPNSIFFALKGENFNGNKFALKALENGASMAVVDEDIEGENPNILKVDNVLETLQELSNFHRKKLDIPVIGITGSNGKTTTKELCHAVLSSKYKTLSTKGNLNNHIGVPLTLLEIDKSHQIAIVEMGANHVGEIEDLCQISMPNMGIITNIGKAHLEGFGSLNGIISTKNALYNYVINKNGKLFVNGDSELLMNLSEKSKRYTYGTKNSELIGKISHINQPFLSIELPQYNKTIKTKLIGDYNINNVLAAVSLGIHFQIHIDNIIKSIEEYSPSNNRSQYIVTENNRVILDAYNANPTSTIEALKNFKTLSDDNKIVILGDMLELGKDSASEHINILEKLQKMDLDRAILVGKEYEKHKSNFNFEYFEDASSLIKYLKESPLQNLTILIKGSRGIKLETLLPYL